MPNAISLVVRSLLISKRRDTTGTGKLYGNVGSNWLTSTEKRTTLGSGPGQPLFVSR